MTEKAKRRAPVAKADTDHGWHKIADDLRVATVCADLTASQRVVLGWVEAMTYGRKLVVDGKTIPLKTTPYTWRRVARDTGRSAGRIHEAGVALLRDLVLVVDARGWIGYNTRVSHWKVEILGDGFQQRMGVLTTAALEHEAGGGQPAQASKHKDAPAAPRTPGKPVQAAQDGLQASFDRVYAAYPNKDRRLAAAKVWASLGVDQATEAAILDAIKAQSKTAKWTKDGGEWVPALVTWLTERRWEDAKAAPATTGASPAKCQRCFNGVPEDGAKWCKGCAWCAPCDSAGRQSSKPAATLKELKDGSGLVCQECLKGRK